MKKTFTTILILLFTSLSVQAYTSDLDPERMKKNIEELVEYFDSKGYDIQILMDDSRFKLVERITQKFTRSAEVKIESNEDYKKAVGFDRKTKLISEFIQENLVYLQDAEEEYGIPTHVIAAIIGIESEFGKYYGSYNPFNVYVSMYAEGHRSNFAKSQLEELLIFVNKNDIDILELKSSYAGAMSYAQFIPSSLNRWWVGSDLYDMPNNIKSVANYLAHFKEITGSLEKSIYRYNPSDLYTQAVLSLAEEAKAVIKKTD